ncbi:glycoside hydrolase family 2 TIM barrel-domain containing protein [Allofournierella sp.]|uniref:glycoside hydrolase family 2 TIM barrel-domain containing protein n=1 Tax=Allofournierella sp. TaxID=1940256 RepID=UPI003AB1E69B
MYLMEQNDWANLEVLQRNRLPARAHFYPFQSIEAARAGRLEESSRVELLNGLWDFVWYDSPLHVPADTPSTPPAFSSSLQVPLNWQYAGYGKFHYTDMDYPFPVAPPSIPANNETGVYKRWFTLKEAGKERQFLRFEGVESAFHVYVNGQMAGYSQGSRMPAEFEITSFVHPGENLLCVVVYQYCDGTYLEAQDMWWLGGIIRDVLLLHRPACYLQDLVLDPDYDLAQGSGILNLSPHYENGRLEVLVYKDDTLLCEAAVPPQGLRMHVPGVEAWNAEAPVCYQVVAALKDEQGRLMEAAGFQVGFRHIAIEQGELRLNGQRILMKGYNRHEYDARKGRVVTRSQTEQELRLIRSAGLNAVRTSHYPNNPFFYELCDALGLYVIDECDLESDGLTPVGQQTRLANDEKWRQAYLDRVERMVKRDRNFACVLLWSLGNESGYGVNFEAMYRWCKQNEPSRPVHYEGDVHGHSVDVSSTMYTSLGELYELDTQVPKRPHILCEFGHGMGNGPGGLAEYCDLVYASQRIQGMFAWEFKDHGVYRALPDGKETYLYGGDFGERYHNGNFCLDGFVAADGVPTPAFYEYAAAASSIRLESCVLEDLKFTFYNGWDFTDLAAAELACRLVEGERTVCQWVEPLPHVPPHHRGEVQLKRQALQSTGPVWLELAVQYKRQPGGAAAEQEIWHSRFLLREAPSVPQTMQGAPQWTQTLEGVRVWSDAFELTISAVDGCIVNYRYGGELLLHKGPELTLFRAYTDNDIKYRDIWEHSHLDSLQTVVKELRGETKKDHVAVSAKLWVGPGGIAWGADMTVCYRIDRSGNLTMELEGCFSGAGLPPALPRLGTVSRLAKELEQIVYRGRGPGENYSDSRAAAQDGVWQSQADHWDVGYLRPQENGNRTEVQWVAAQNGTQGMVLAARNTVELSLSSYEDCDLLAAAHRAQLRPRPYRILHFDLQNSGLGSASCGPLPLRHYRVHPLPFACEFALCPLKGRPPQFAAGYAQGLMLGEKQGGLK